MIRELCSQPGIGYILDRLNVISPSGNMRAIDGVKIANTITYVPGEGSPWFATDESPFTRLSCKIPAELSRDPGSCPGITVPMSYC